MKTSYSANLTLPDGRIWQSVECDLDCSIDFENGEPVLSVDDVLVDVSNPREPSRYVSMFCASASPLMAMTGHEIRAIAEADDELLSQALEAEGIVFVGGLGNPSSRIRRVA